MNCLFTTRTLLIVLTVCTFTNEVRCKIADFNSLSTFAAYTDHRASVEVMHVLVILFHETFVHSFAKLTDLLFIYNVFAGISTFFGNLNEFVSRIEILLLSLSTSLCCLRFYGFLLETLRLFLLNCFSNWGPLFLYGRLYLILLRLIVRISIFYYNRPILVILLLTVHVFAWEILSRRLVDLLTFLPRFLLERLRLRLIFYGVVPAIGNGRYGGGRLFFNLSANLRLPISRF